ncbi:hypothetical protein VYU27_001177 [Nannochloropsis oceanica]
MHPRVFFHRYRPTTTVLRRRAFSTRLEPVTSTNLMAQHPHKTGLAGITVGYFVAMYLERTKYKDEFVRDERHKPVLALPDVSK